ncbi:MAG: AraC family transcriptional regulator [Clostridia bacterium]
MQKGGYYFSKTSDPYINDKYQLHCHSFYELYYFINGDIKYMVEGKIYTPKPYSIFLFKPGVVHGLQNVSDTTYTRYTFHFDEEFLPIEHKELLLSSFHGESIYFENINLVSSADLVLEAKTFEDETLSDFAIKLRFETLLTQLFPLGNLKGDDPKDNLAFKITAYIDENFNKNLCLGTIASTFFISKSQLSRIFKKDLNSTVGNYIALKRSVKAKQLINQGYSASTVATLCGFKDYSTFFRTYKKHMGVSPTVAKEE